MSLLCTICARGGSKGVVGKNARDLLGKPVLAWSIAQARETGLFDAIAFSSDSDALLDAALKAGADIAVKRPDAMATDTAPKLPAIRHCLEQAIAQTGKTPEIFVWPPTSPALWNCCARAVRATSSRGLRRAARPISTWSSNAPMAASASPNPPILRSRAGRTRRAAST
jgi:hypothetical protein